MTRPRDTINDRIRILMDAGVTYDEDEARRMVTGEGFRQDEQNKPKEAA